MEKISVRKGQRWKSKDVHPKKGHDQFMTPTNNPAELKLIQELADWINVECGNDTEVSSERLATALIKLGYRRHPTVKPSVNQIMDIINKEVEFSYGHLNGVHEASQAIVNFIEGETAK